MNNYERIKNMSLDEMAKCIGDIYGSDIWCDKCIENFEDCYDHNSNRCHCIKYAKQWLEKECEE